MRLTTDALRQAVLRKRKAIDEAEGLRQRARQQSPIQPSTRSPPRLLPPLSLAQEGEGQELGHTVDLTADSPEERGVERAGRAEEAVEPAVGSIEGAIPSAGEGAALAMAEGDAPTAGEGAASAAAEGEAPPTTERVEGVESAGEPTTRAASAVPPRPVEESERAEGSGIPTIPPRCSLLNHGRRVKRLMKQICLPEFQTELCSQSAGTFF